MDAKKLINKLATFNEKTGVFRFNDDVKILNIPDGTDLYFSEIDGLEKIEFNNVANVINGSGVVIGSPTLIDIDFGKLKIINGKLSISRTSGLTTIDFKSLSNILGHITIEDCDNVKNIIFQTQTNLFSSVYFYNLPSLISLDLSNFASNFMHAAFININRCDSLNNIKFKLLNLRMITLRDLPSLKTIDFGSNFIVDEFRITKEISKRKILCSGHCNVKRAFRVFDDNGFSIVTEIKGPFDF